MKKLFHFILPMAVGCFLLSLVSRTVDARDLFNEDVHYGACLKESAEAAIDQLEKEVPQQRPWVIKNRRGEYDRLTTGMTGDNMDLRSYLPLGNKTEMITWSNDKMSVSATATEKDPGCEVIKVTLNIYKK